MGTKPTTSQVNVGLQETFEQFAEEPPCFMAFFISLITGPGSAVMARDLVLEDYPEAKS